MADRLWNFCTERYARRDVSALCLELQDRSDADICLVLFCLWHGQHGSSVCGGQLAGLIAGDIGRWHRQVVRSLRAARKAMKQPPVGFRSAEVEHDREQVKALELSAERKELRLLAEIAPPSGGDATAKDPAVRRRVAAANLAAYLELLSKSEDACVTALSTRLVERCVS